ncbi:hypothetical protein ACFWGM_23710, partial [Streptomyces roseolus]|uniref:hypothetical protein n=1 Tax=Streptomyces roseolus TaxID=67358 RepID=UPI003655CD6B
NGGLARAFVDQIGTAYFTGAPLGLHIAAWDGLNIVDLVSSPTGVPLTFLDSFAVRNPVVDAPAFGDVHPPGKFRPRGSAVVALGAGQEYHFTEIFGHAPNFPVTKPL